MAVNYELAYIRYKIDKGIIISKNSADKTKEEVLEALKKLQTEMKQEIENVKAPGGSSKAPVAAPAKADLSPPKEGEKEKKDDLNPLDII